MNVLLTWPGLTAVRWDYIFGRSSIPNRHGRIGDGDEVDVCCAGQVPRATFGFHLGHRARARAGRPKGAPRVPSRLPAQTRLGACGEAALRERPTAMSPVHAERSHLQGRRTPQGAVGRAV